MRGRTLILVLLVGSLTKLKTLNAANLVSGRFGKSLSGKLSAEEDVKNFNAWVISMALLRGGPENTGSAFGLGGMIDFMPVTYTVNEIQKNGFGFNFSFLANWISQRQNWDFDLSLSLSAYNYLRLTSFSKGVVNDVNVTHSGSSVLTGNFGLEFGGGFMKKFKVFGSRARAGFSSTYRKLFFNTLEEKTLNSKNQNQTTNSKVSYSAELISLFLNLDYEL